jgi:inorganic triphosphatase YgiF
MVARRFVLLVFLKSIFLKFLRHNVTYREELFSYNTNKNKEEINMKIVKNVCECFICGQMINREATEEMPIKLGWYDPDESKSIVTLPLCADCNTELCNKIWRMIRIKETNRELSELLEDLRTMTPIRGFKS